jgi:dimethylaniline monooxygenase (N-oxide forming)
MFALMQNGFAEPVSAVEAVLGPRQVRLVDGRTLKDVDAILYCTGYESRITIFIAGFNPYPVAREPPHLYRRIFPLHADPGCGTHYGI